MKSLLSSALMGTLGLPCFPSHGATISRRKLSWNVSRRLGRPRQLVCFGNLMGEMISKRDSCNTFRQAAFSVSSRKRIGELVHLDSLMLWRQKKPWKWLRHASAPIATCFLEDPVEGSVIAISWISTENPRVR